MLPRDAFVATTEMVKAKDASGRINAEFITPSPPRISAVAPGELLDDRLVGYLEEVVANGAFVEALRIRRSIGTGSSPTDLWPH
jgi:arginine/lysine/ornithine decarboxylase